MQLFSSPQLTHASKTKTEPTEKVKLLISSKVSTILDNVIKKIAVHILFPTASLKINNAIIAVATISKLFNKEAFDDVVFVSPIIRNMGAAISRIIIPIIYGSSFFVKLAS